MDSKGPSATLFLNGKRNPEDLVVLGEQKLLVGHLSEALDLFKEAETIDDARSDLNYRQALALFEYGSEEGREAALALASKKLKKAHLLDPKSAEILHTWGNVLCQLGERLEQSHYFHSAKDKYEKVFALGECSAELFWDYGAIWYHIGTLSEEAIDLQKSLKSFESAVLEADSLPSDFWIDYGATALLLSTKVKDIRLIVKAVNCFKHSISHDKNSFNSWSSLAEALQMLYEQTHDEDHFSAANEAFATALKLSPHESDHCLEWAKFLLTSAKRNGDITRLRTCLEKCHYAYAYDSENALILAIWAEALALLGQMTEKLDLIYEAENKIAEALELDEEDPEVWHCLGMCFCSFGQYFNDYDYYYQAIEKFQTGLSIDRSYDPLWHAMANAYATVGTLEEDVDSLIQSLKFYEKSLSFCDSSTRQIDYASALSKLGEITQEQKWFQQALWHYETALSMQKNAVYLHPNWLFSYASALDMMGDFHEDEKYYTRAIEIFSHVLMVDPDFPKLHHRLAQAFCHLGELLGEIDSFYRAIHHLRLALKHDEDNDSMILDWGIALIHIAQHTSVMTDIEQLLFDAEQKLTLAAKLGNVQGYYYLSCLYSLTRQYEKSLYFLQKADHFNALPPLEELLGDEWLDGLRCTPMFQEFLAEHPHLN